MNEIIEPTDRDISLEILSPQSRATGRGGSDGPAGTIP